MPTGTQRTDHDDDDMAAQNNPKRYEILTVRDKRQQQVWHESKVPLIRFIVTFPSVGTFNKHQRQTTCIFDQNPWSKL